MRRVFRVPVEAKRPLFRDVSAARHVDSIRALLETEGRKYRRKRKTIRMIRRSSGMVSRPSRCLAQPTSFVRSYRDAARRNGIPEVRIGPSTGTSDMRHFAKRNIPCLLYGPGRGFNPHRPDEHFLLDDLPFMMKALPRHGCRVV